MQYGALWGKDRNKSGVGPDPLAAAMLFNADKQRDGYKYKLVAAAAAEPRLAHSSICLWLSNGTARLRGQLPPTLTVFNPDEELSVCLLAE